MIPLKSNANVDNSDSANYPDGRIKDNQGTGNGTPVNRSVYGDLHSNISKLMRLYGIAPNGFPDNETTGYQIIQALSALASKNDYIYPLNTDGAILSVDVKLSYMNNNEFLVCLASTNKTIETQIKGIGAGTFAVTYSGTFKANEYVRVIKTSSGVSIIRLADWNSLSSMVTELGFLKKATQSEENTGTIDTVATTPLTNLTAFTKRVIGLDSGGFLATAIRNGLYPKEHYAIVAGLGSKTINIGWVNGINAGMSVGVTLGKSGDVSNAITTTGSGGGATIVEVTLPNPMNGVNYYVELIPESQNSFNQDWNIFQNLFKPISSTVFQFCVVESGNATQSIKVHFQAINI